MRIYLAGPMFTTAERSFNARVKELLAEKGHEVWLPQESEPKLMTPREIFRKNVQGIDWAEVVVANMDGSDPDSGTSWECGYAYQKKWVLLFRTDFRVTYEVPRNSQAVLDRDEASYNLMLTESADVRLDLPFKAAEEIVTEIDTALQNLVGQNHKERL